MTNTSQVQYTGGGLTYISVTPNQTLDVILGEINTAVNTHNTAPDYSGYNLGPYNGISITETDGVTHPTNTQNFAEGIAKIVCNDVYNLTHFLGVTYVANQLVLTNAINALQVPGVTYATFSITNTDTASQILTKMFTGFNTAGLNTLTSTIDPYTANWSTLSISASHSVITTWNNVIAYISALVSTVAGKQATLGTFNATAIGGGATDSITTTVTELIAYAATLPTFSVAGYTWGCVSSASTLTATIQNVLTTIASLGANTVQGATIGLTMTTISACGGKNLAIDTTWTGLYKVMLSSGDAYGDAAYLDQKIESSDNSLTLGITGHKLNLTVTTPVSYEVKVNSSDSTPDYLNNKIVGAFDSNWGLSIGTGIVNNKVQILPTIGNPELTFQSMMSFIASDPTLLTQFANLIAISQNVPGLGITDLVVTLTAGTFVCTWTAASGVSQQAKFRQSGDVLWTTSSFTPANPLSAVAVTTTSSLGSQNKPIQFQVDTIYPTGLIGSNIYEMIHYVCQTDTHAAVGGVISISQVALPGIETIEYRLILNAGSVLQQTILTSGITPGVTFTSVGAGTYHVAWRYGTTINGTTLWSNDASQLNAMCTSSNITI